MTDPLPDGKEPCRNACGRAMATRNGEPAYKGFCSRCYKEDVARRRGEPTPASLPKKPVLDPMDAPGSKAAERPHQETSGKLSWCLEGRHPGVEKPEDLHEGPNFGYWVTCPGSITLSGSGTVMACKCACHAE